MEATLAAREALRFIQRFGRTPAKMRSASHLAARKSLLLYVHVRAAQSNAVSALKKGRDGIYLKINIASKPTLLSVQESHSVWLEG